MKKALGIALALCFASEMTLAQETSLVSTQPKPKRNAFRSYKGDVTFGMSAREFSGDVVSARFSRMVLDANFEAEFTSWLDARLQAAQLFTSGATSNLYAAPEGGSGTNGLFLTEGSLSLKPVDGVVAKGGILSLGINPISSLMSDASWAGYSVGLKQKLGGLTLGADAAQAIPTARGTSNRIVDEDTLPLFTTGTVHAEMKFGDTGFSTKAAASHFIFTDPASQAAQDSQQVGSTVVGNSRSGFLFAYEFRGMEYGLELKQKFANEDEISVKGALTENTEAPEGMNLGSRYSVRYMRAGDQWNSSVTLTGFEIQSDVLPATYTSPSFGFTNRVGNSISLRFDNKKHNFGLSGAYTRANILDETALAARFQGDNEIFTFGAEVSHDLF